MYLMIERDIVGAGQRIMTEGRKGEFAGYNS